MKYLYYLVPCIFGLFCSCQKSGAILTDKKCTLNGRYFNRTVLDQCPQSLPANIPNYALDLSFKGKDTVAINNGVEKYSLPYTATGNNCEFKIAGATQFGDMIFSLTADSTLLLYDSAWTKVNTPSKFRNDGNANKADWDFENYLNECVIAGSYVISRKEGAPTRVIFLPNGQVTGLRNYLSYKLCFAGDCLEETDPPATTIEFINSEGKPESFVLKMPDAHKLVQFYSIGEPIPDIKGGRSIGPLAFEINAETGMESE